ncbi:MAG: Smr/MutS family protein [Erysipelotrichaceae bacterium]|nr:Smr/MutS family protein [Erysipelotrichaceae bacterium]
MNNYNSIDLNKVKEQVLEFCAIDDSKTFILNEEVSFNPLQIKKNLRQSDEVIKLLNKGFNISFDGIENISDIFENANKNIVLSTIELSKILSFHNHCRRIKNKIDEIEDDYLIKDYSDSININEDLARRIGKVVDINGGIKEDASEKLSSIFYEINRNLDSIHSLSASFISKNNAYLQENNVFYRNDRVTFLLKNSAKNKFNGYQYGTSASGLASYVEPEQFIELNNKKLSLENDKQEEVNRLLKELTYYVSLYSQLYIANFDSIMMLDVIFAKGEYGYNKGGIVAKINSDNYLFLKNIAHPLIASNLVVSNTYELNNEYQGIVISGTNTGGKTVGLKLIGLSVLMSYLGIPLIAEEAQIPLYDNIYIDIDDNQSINNALSTFSAHISNINKILNNATEDSLILIDELISGTDPKEAQAISLAILEKILELKSKFVITTHYDEIKQFSFNNERILLSSVGFDLDELKPTYKYIENSIGMSNAIDIADRYFDSKEIIDNARKFLNINKSKEDELLEKLSIEIKENESLKEKLNNELLINKNLNLELNQRLKEIDDNKNNIYIEYKKQLNNYLINIKKEINDKVEALNDEKKASKLFSRIEQLKEVEDIKEEITLNVGDNVRLESGNQIGKILDINGEYANVSINGLNIKTNLNKLIKVNQQVKKEYKPRQRMESVSMELNLVGKRVEEALVILDDYLDHAYGYNLKTVKIIHGFGTGQLRKAIREHLKTNKIVKEFENGDIYDGGSNVTIVKFK